jgi:hypothetical protein
MNRRHQFITVIASALMALPSPVPPGVGAMPQEFR